MGAINDYGPELSSGLRGLIDEYRRRMLAQDEPDLPNAPEERDYPPSADGMAGPSRAQILARSQGSMPDSMRMFDQMLALAPQSAPRGDVMPIVSAEGGSGLMPEPSQMTGPDRMQYFGQFPALAMGQSPGQGPYPSSMPNAEFLNALSGNRSLLPSLAKQNGMPSNLADQLGQGDGGQSQLDIIGRALPTQEQLLAAIGQPPQETMVQRPPGVVAGQSPSEGMGFAVPAQDALRNIQLRNMSSAMLAGQPGMLGADNSGATLQQNPYQELMRGIQGPQQNPYVNTVRNMQGEVLSQMAYPQGADGSYGPGQLINRRGGYNNGQYENPIVNGNEFGRGELSVQQMYQDAVERNMADRRGSPFGYGIDPTTARRMAIAEMAPIVQDRETQMRALEGERDRQNRLQLAQQQIEAGRFAQKEDRTLGMLKSYTDAVGQGRKEEIDQQMFEALGPNWKAIAFGDKAARAMTGPQMPPGTAQAMAPPASGVSPQGAAIASQPTAPTGQVTTQPASKQKIMSFLQGAADVMEKGTAFSPLTNNKNDLPIAGTAASFGPDQQVEFLNRLAGAGLNQREHELLADQIMRAPGGQNMRNALISRYLSDRVVAEPPPSQAPGVGGFLRSAITGLPAAPVYPAKVTFSDQFPGVELLGGGARIKNTTDRRNLPYDQARLPGGQTVNLDIPASLTGFRDVMGGQQRYNDSFQARRAAAEGLVQALLRQRQ